MKKVGIILIVILSVIMIGGIIGGVLYARIYTNPFNRVTYAVSKSMKADREDVSYKMKYTLVPEKYEESTGVTLYDEEKAMLLYANALLENTEIEINYKQDINEKDPLDSQLQYTANINYADEKLADFMVRMYDDSFEALMPSLITKTFFVTKKDIFDQINFDYEKFEVEKYVKIIKGNKKLLKKVDEGDYFDIIKSTYEDKITKGDSVQLELSDKSKVKCREYTVEVNYEDLVTLIKDFKKELAEDDAFREYIRGTALEILEELLDSKDYKAFNMEKEDVEDAISYFEDADKFKSAYDELMTNLDDMIAELENIPQETRMDYEVTYLIDIRNNVRGMNMVMDYGYLKADAQMVINSINKKVTFDSFKDNERIDIMSLVDKDESEINDLVKEMLVDAGDKVIANKALDKLLKDMRSNSNLLPEETKEAFMSSLNDFESNKETYIQTMIDGIVNSLTDPYSDY